MKDRALLRNAALALALLAGLWMISFFHRAATSTASSSAAALDLNAAGPGAPAKSETPAATVVADASATGPAASAVSSTNAISFKDVRPLTDAKSGAKSPAAAEPLKPDAAAMDAPASGPSFKDTRPLPGAEALKVSGKPGDPPANFHDERPLAATSFHDERLVEAPAFRDERPIAAPTFHDERLVTQPAFRDDRALSTSSFADPRPLALGVGTASAAVTPAPVAANVTNDAAASTTAPVATTIPAALMPPSPTVQPETPPVASGPLPTLVAMSPSSIRLEGNAGCRDTEISTEPLDGGQMRIRINAGCHAGEAVQLSYAGAEFIRKLNNWGALDFVLDCFAGSASAVEVRLADGTRKTLPVVASDLDKVSKIAVVWRSAVNLDLHVFEYGARDEESGHVWAKAPSSVQSARIAAQTDKRGHGVLSAVDDSESLGDKVEVYTFIHNDEQSTGTIAMALDYETRGEKPQGASCGSGALAEVDFQVNILPRNGQVSRQSGVLARVECGSIIPHEARFNQSALPVLRIKK